MPRILQYQEPTCFRFIPCSFRRDKINAIKTGRSKIAKNRLIRANITGKSTVLKFILIAGFIFLLSEEEEKEGTEVIRKTTKNTKSFLLERTQTMHTG